MTIAFLEGTNNPIYLVDFNRYKVKGEIDLDALKKILKCSQRSLQLVGIFFVSFKDAAGAF